MPQTRSHRRKRPTAVDLFCGSGGLTLGLRQAGFSVIGAVDNDPLAVESYKMNHHRVRVWETDIRRLDVLDVKRGLGLKKRQLDLLSGCPPCQGFSTLRTLNGARSVHDERNDLIAEFMRFVRDLLPRAVMMENVPGLVEDDRFGAFNKELGRLGYSVQYHVADAASFGVPQRRRRLVLVASRVGHVSLPEGGRTQTVRSALNRVIRHSPRTDALHNYEERRSKAVYSLICDIPADGGGRRALGVDRQLGCHQRSDGFKDVYGRLSWSKVSSTITSGCINPSKGRFLHPEEHRAITLREAATLQSFPVSYAFSLARGRYQTAALIGNAFPPVMGRKHAIEIRKVLRP